VKHEVYQGSGGNWYWRIRAKNGRIIADGAEGYVSKQNAVRAFKRFLELMAEY